MVEPYDRTTLTASEQNYMESDAHSLQCEVCSTFNAILVNSLAHPCPPPSLSVILDTAVHLN